MKTFQVFMLTTYFCALCLYCHFGVSIMQYNIIFFFIIINRYCQFPQTIFFVMKTHLHACARSITGGVGVKLTRVQLLLTACQKCYTQILAESYPFRCSRIDAMSQHTKCFVCATLFHFYYKVILFKLYGSYFLFINVKYLAFQFHF